MNSLIKTINYFNEKFRRKKSKIHFFTISYQICQPLSSFFLCNNGVFSRYLWATGTGWRGDFGELA
jgi:hypothetical protein